MSSTQRTVWDPQKTSRDPALSRLSATNALQKQQYEAKYGPNMVPYQISKNTKPDLPVFNFSGGAPPPPSNTQAPIPGTPGAYQRPSAQTGGPGGQGTDLVSLLTGAAGIREAGGNLSQATGQGNRIPRDQIRGTPDVTVAPPPPPPGWVGSTKPEETTQGVYGAQTPDISSVREVTTQGYNANDPWVAQQEQALGGIGAQRNAALAAIDQAVAGQGRKAAEMNAAAGRGVGGGLAGLEAQVALGGMQQRQQTLGDFAGKEAALRGEYAQRLLDTGEAGKDRGLTADRYNQMRDTLGFGQQADQAAQAAQATANRDAGELTANTALTMSYLDMMGNLDPETAKMLQQTGAMPTAPAGVGGVGAPPPPPLGRGAPPPLAPVSNPGGPQPGLQRPPSGPGGEPVVSGPDGGLYYVDSDGAYLRWSPDIGQWIPGENPWKAPPKRTGLGQQISDVWNSTF